MIKRFCFARDAVNPARAGMILSSSATASRDHGKPRASGDDPEKVTSGLRIPK